jgi:hypothetical protein
VDEVLIGKFIYTHVCIYPDICLGGAWKRFVSREFYLSNEKLYVHCHTMSKWVSTEQDAEVIIKENEGFQLSESASHISFIYLWKEIIILEKLNFKELRIIYYVIFCCDDSDMIARNVAIIISIHSNKILFSLLGCRVSYFNDVPSYTYLWSISNISDSAKKVIKAWENACKETRMNDKSDFSITKKKCFESYS